MPILSLDLLTIGLIGMSFDKTSWGVSSFMYIVFLILNKTHIKVSSVES